MKSKIHKVKIGRLKTDKSILQKQIRELRKWRTKNKDENEELEQYCDGIDMVK